MNDNGNTSGDNVINATERFLIRKTNKDRSRIIADLSAHSDNMYALSRKLAYCSEMDNDTDDADSESFDQNRVDMIKCILKEAIMVGKIAKSAELGEQWAIEEANLIHDNIIDINFNSD